MKFLSKQCMGIIMCTLIAAPTCSAFSVPALLRTRKKTTMTRKKATRDVTTTEEEAIPASLTARAIAVVMGMVYGSMQQLMTNVLVNFSITDGDPADQTLFDARRKLKESIGTGTALLAMRESGTINDLAFFAAIREYEAQLISKYTTASVESLRKPHKIGHEIGVAAANLTYIWLKRFAPAHNTSVPA